MAKKTFTAYIGQKEYAPFKKLENKTGEQLYNELGLKRSDIVCTSFKVDPQFTLHVSQEISHHEDELTYSVATLEDTVNNKYYDNDDCGDSILGEWFFIIENGDEISVIVEEK